MRKQIVFILIICAVSLSAFSQTEIQFYDSARHFYSDYITSYRDSLLGLSILTTNKYSKFQINDISPNSQHKTIKFAPNEKTKFGIGIDYKWLGIKIAFIPLPTSEKDNKLYGKTSQFDLQAHVYLRKFIVDGYYQDYKGYYVENPKELDPLWKDGPYPIRNDIRTLAAGVSFKYLFNYKKFSYKSSFTQTEVQKKSVGSFMLGGFTSYFRMAADSDIVSYPPNNLFSDTTKITIANVLGAGVSVGYVYTFVIHSNWYATLSVVPGIGFQAGRFEKKHGKRQDKKPEPIFNGHARFAAGYNGPLYFFGIAAIGENFYVRSSASSQLNYSMGNVRLYFGRRFNGEKITNLFKKKKKV